MLKTLEICVFGLQGSQQKRSRTIFRRCECPPGTLQCGDPTPRGRLRAPKKVPGSSQGPPRSTLENFIMAPFFLEILDFQFLHVFPRYFNNFAIGFFVCKCALVSFYTYFLRILTILQISFIFQTPPRPPQGPPQDPLGPGQTEWAHTAGSDSSSTNDVCKVEWVHTAGSNSSNTKNVCNVESAHTAGSDSSNTKNACKVE